MLASIDRLDDVRNLALNMGGALVWHLPCHIEPNRSIACLPTQHELILSVLLKLHNILPKQQ